MSARLLRIYLFCGPHDGVRCAYTHTHTHRKHPHTSSSLSVRLIACCAVVVARNIQSRRTQLFRNHRKPCARTHTHFSTGGRAFVECACVAPVCACVYTACPACARPLLTEHAYQKRQRGIQLISPRYFASVVRGSRAECT